MPELFIRSTAGDRMRKAIGDAHQKFSKNKRRLWDLSPRFWVAFLDLEVCAEHGTDEEVAAAIAAAHRVLGAPGDFAYGTPCGDALRELYDALTSFRKGPTA